MTWQSIRNEIGPALVTAATAYLGAGVDSAVRVGTREIAGASGAGDSVRAEAARQVTSSAIQEGATDAAKSDLACKAIKADCK
jgi:hypothetical protein